MHFSSKSINKYFSQGTKNSQNYTLEHIIVVNASDLATTNFACYMNDSFSPVNMTYYYNSSN
jgi:hypothetical protein